MQKSNTTFSTSDRNRVTMYVILLLILCPAGTLLADPKPGDVFREYHFANGRGVHLCPQGAVRDSADFTINVNDLQGAIRAELTGLFHTGHIGTSERRIRVNSGKPFDLPRSNIPAGRDECYFTYLFGRPSVNVPLKDLREGENNLTLFVGPQICHGFNWPCYGFHSMILRIYYDNNKPHPSGAIEYPQDGHVITNDELMIKTKVQTSQSAIASVDIVGYYYDYPFEGSGKFLDWHYLIDEYGRWFGFINRTARSPYHETWNLEWIPDQPEPIKLMARVTDTNGMSYMTQAVENIILRRDKHSVTMCKTAAVPENFKVRVNETMKSRFEPIGNLSQISKVKLVSIIPVGHLEKKYYSVCGINDVKLKQYQGLPDLNSDFFYDSYLDVDPAVLRDGINEFFVHSDTEGHMTEVCWPGPALMVRRNRGTVAQKR